MRIQVRLFAVLRERAGAETLDLDLDEGATAADALHALGSMGSIGEALDGASVVVAVNREYSPLHARLHDGDEIAVIPPVSGGGELHARVREEPLSAESLAQSLRHPSAGAVVVFEGITREVERLEYEAYSEMAEARMTEILASAIERHQLEGAAAEHRVGTVPLSEPSVVVAVSAAHRKQAFAGAREIIDRIKAEAPIWKKEMDGDRGGWVEGVLPPTSESEAG